MNARTKAKKYKSELAAVKRAVSAIRDELRTVTIGANNRPLAHRSLTEIVEMCQGKLPHLFPLIKKVVKVDVFRLNLTLDSYDFLGRTEDQARAFLTYRLENAAREIVGRMVLAGVVKSTRNETEVTNASPSHNE